MNAIRTFLVTSTLVLTATLALAQGGPGGGAGPGAGARMQGAGPAASAPGMGAGPGQRAGRQGAARWGSDYTPGWSLMTQTERNEHRDRLRSMTSYPECQAYVAQHHEQMAARANERNQSVPKPRRDACAALKP